MKSDYDVVERLEILPIAGHIANVDVETGLFEDLAPDGVAEALTGLDAASGERPVVAKRLVAAPDEEDLAVPNDQSGDSTDFYLVLHEHASPLGSILTE